MNRRTLILLAACVALNCLIALFSFTVSAQENQTSSAARIFVGPNLLVSRTDADTPHAETMLVVNPRDGRNLLGASIVFTRQVYGTTCKVYASRDGGQTWTDASFPEQFRFGSADPQVGFGLHGTAYFLMLSSGETGAIHFYRSEDGGVTWEQARNLRGGDHPQMIVDLTRGRFAGRIYMTAMYGVRRLAVSRSDTDGRDFIQFVEVPNPRNLFILNMNPLVFSDGTLFVPYLAWDDAGGSRPPPVTLNEFVTSSDGGITFSAPARVMEQPFRAYVRPTQLRGSFASGTNTVYAIDSRNDNLYLLASDDRSGQRRAWFSRSTDRGRTWSAPQQIGGNVPPASAQYQPMLAVNGEGAIGAAWFDTRDATGGDGYHLYFAASVDSGQSFTPARRVSSEISRPISSTNLTPFQAYSRTTRESALEQRFRTAFGRWGNGGDYMGFTADSDGRFRPFWIDSRSGVFQVWTTEIRVARPGANAPPEMSAPAGLRLTPLTARVRLILDPPRYDLQRQEALIPIRLQNISTENIYAPFTVEVKNTGEWTLLNGQRSGSETLMDYSQSLSDFRALRPGALTEAVLWRFNYSGLGSSPTINVEVRGHLPSAR